MFLAVDQPQPNEPEKATNRTAYTSTSVPVQQSADSLSFGRISIRNISEIHSEVLAAGKDKLRLECDYIKLKNEKKCLQNFIYIDYIN